MYACTKRDWRYLVYTHSITYDFSPLTLTLFFSGTFRVDVLKKDATYAVFYQVLLITFLSLTAVSC